MRTLSATQALMLLLAFSVSVFILGCCYITHAIQPHSSRYLKTVNGVLKETYQAACHARGLLENDDHWEYTLREASLLQCPVQLRELFFVILLFCQPSEPLKL